MTRVAITRSVKTSSWSGPVFCGALPFMASALAQAGLLTGDPRVGRLGNQPAQYYSRRS
jgi:hypothetical protein